MDRPKHCFRCRSVEIENLNDDETEDGTVEYWHCRKCLCEWGVELKITQIICDGGPDNVVKLTG